ncbi:MAG TPA: fused MFS/spermidine synthase [Gemmatimonadales bacterium]|nr:fused MFS/spermidine synthase [Gemmatimonadales bacterium]
MTRPAAEPSPALPIATRVLPFLPLLFIASGCAALIYEIVWFQMLQLIVGSSAISLGVVLGTFMGGMCLGSLLLPRFVSNREHPLLVYAKLEAGIGVFGLLILFGLPYAGGLYIAIAGLGMTGLFLRGVLCAICLLIPTMFMGATLPAMARWVEATPTGVSWLGFFYGGNIAGAVFGSILAGFYLLRVYDSAVATYVAVAINVVVALAGLGLARLTPHQGQDVPAPAPPEAAIPSGAWPVYVAIALSGFTALGAEVVWTRLLTLVLGGTVYAFSLILAAFLIGLGIGSAAGSFAAGTVKAPRAVLGWCQLLLVAAIAWGAWSLNSALPYWPVDPSLSSSVGLTFQIDIVRCLWTILPAALLWGASFPLALAAVADGQRDPGRMVAGVYAANTVGAILGAVLTSICFIAWFGTQGSHRILIVLAAVAALITLVPVVVGSGALAWRARRMAWGAVAVVATGLVVVGIAPVSEMLIAYGRFTASWLPNHATIIFHGEGMNSSMAVSRTANGVLNYHNAGKIQASSEPQDMRLQRMLGHMTTLLPAHPASVLVIGCGAGVTAGAVSVDPAVEHETIAEIEPLVPKVVSRYFSEHNFAVVDNPKVKVQIDDARHFVLTTDQKFDAVTSDPFDPWVRGAATLYTAEFFDLVKKHLNPGGVVTLFVQLYESSPETVKSEVGTFMEAFPNGLVFGNTENGKGYDLVLVGQLTPGPIDLTAIDAKLGRPEYSVVAQSLREIGINSAEDLFGTYTANGTQLKPWLADAQINRDRNLRLQYLAGFGLNMYRQAEIYDQMLQYRQYPDGLFLGTPDRLAAVRAGIMGEQ